MCDNLERTVKELAQTGVTLARPISKERWGLATAIALPGGSELGLYEPHHPTAIG